LAAGTGFFFSGAAASAAFLADLSYLLGLIVAAASSIFYFFLGIIASVYFMTAGCPNLPYSTPISLRAYSLTSASLSSTTLFTHSSSSL